MTLLLRSCLLLICGVLSLAATAQENYLDGYIVLPQKDTVRGQIDYRQWKYNPRQISFVDGRTGKKSEFTPGGLAAFFVSGETYRSFTVKIYPYTLNVDLLSNNFHNDAYDSTVFLRLLTGGQLSLYYYEDHKELNYFFIQQSNETPVQLRVKTSVVDNNGLKALDREDLYIDQLRALVSGCPALAGRVGRVAYDDRDLRKLVFSYNNCGKDTVERREAVGPHEKAVRIMPMIGYLHSSVHFSGYAADVVNMSWPGYNGLTGGVGVQFVLPRTRQQFSFFTDVLYSHFYSKSNPYVANTANVETGYIEYNQFQWDLLFRYQLPKGKVKPFIEAGVINSFLFNNNSYISDQEIGVNTDTRSSIFAAPSGTGMKSYEFGFTGGVGVTIGSFSLEGRVQQSNGLSDIEDISAPITNYYLLAAFSF